ncbi:hypothetical protein H0H92_000016 [Tricholoma furcatifolium]|nr:hypothetical protein H0H92_000016 [Tricholoma furcatifolium]
MDAWPVDERRLPTANSEEKYASIARQKVVARGYPQVDAGGPNAITLVQKNGRLEWSSLLNSDSQGAIFLALLSTSLTTGSTVRKLSTGKSTVIFPATRPPSDPPIKTSILHSAERGANFLRTYLPDIDIPAELIREQLSLDAEVTEQLYAFDPCMGNLLQPIVAHDSAFLAFPMGELNCDLNLSPFRAVDDRVVFKPSAHPTRTFDTPIQQIATSIPGMHTPGYMAVRTFGQTSLLEVNTSKTTPYLEEVAVISHADTSGRSLVDVSLSTMPFSALGVTDFGSVYQCNIRAGDKNIDLVHDSVKDEQCFNDSFWRLARSLHNTNYLLASKDSLKQFDTRDGNSVELLTLAGADILTSVEDQQTDHTIKLCSTREILWIDSRFPRKPLLGYKHGRQFDRYLQIHTSPLSPAITLLTSRANAMVTYYDVSRSQGQPIHVNGPPGCFLSANNAITTYVGGTIFKHPLGEKMDAFSLIQLTDEGSLHKVDLSMSDENVLTFDTSWSPELKELEMHPIRAFEPPYSSQEFTEVDLSSTYDKIFRLHEQGREEREQENADSVYNLLENLSTFWQELEPPVDHILTTYDALLRAGDEPAQTSRADFLTESVIQSTRGYRALAQGRLSPMTLEKGAAWHKDITCILQRLDPTFPSDVQSGAEAFKSYDLRENPERSVHSMRYEKEAREQLILDLALSTDIFSSQPFLRGSEEGLALEDLARTLSLAEEPPVVDFGYLRPRLKSHYKTDGEEDSDDLGSMGVRSLIKAWQVGASPEDYVFVDHYDGSAPVPPPIQKLGSAQAKDDAKELVGTQTVQRPPTIVAASALPARPPEVGRRTLVQSQPDFRKVPPLAFGSQVPLTDAQSSQSQSQELMMTSTQVLPGAHGGRPMATKKKAAKKRMGGF